MPALAEDTRDKLAARLLHSPGDFAAAVLGHDHWSLAEQIMDAIAQPRARVAVKSCHASSKTFTAGDIVNWAVAGGNMVVTTAPTATQVEKIMWPEIRNAYANALHPLGGRCLLTQMEIGEGSALGISTDQAVRLQGFHARPGKFLLVIADEGPGLRPELWSAIEGAASGGDVRILVLGNPTIASGPYFEMFNDPAFKHFTIDAFDTPNLQGITLSQLLALPEHDLDNNVRPYLISRRWVKERYDTWGVNDPDWQSRVRGEFPDQSEDALIARSKILAAHERIVTTVEAWPIDAGLDVAGPGDNETYLTVRQGPCILHEWGTTEGDTQRLLFLIGEQLRAYPTTRAVCVDVAGMGWHLAGSLRMHLAQQAAGRLPIILPVNVGSASTNPQRYVNLKAELAWGMRMRFDAGDVAGRMTELTRSQLGAVRWGLTARGKIEIESKEDLAARGVPSPDRFEAMMLAFASDLAVKVAEEQTKTTQLKMGAHATERTEPQGIHAKLEARRKVRGGRR